MPSRLLVFLFTLSLFGCERGCARSWFRDHGVGSEGQRQPPGSGALNAIDCPDGLARCNDGIVEASRLAMITQPCRGSPEQCACSWERVTECDRGCVVDGVEVIVERAKASVQLCAPEPDAGAIARVLTVTSPSRCDEDQQYRCAGGGVVACAEGAVIGTCVRGCSVEGASVGGELAVSREAAYAILCSR
jgi:hypothetical protein